MHGDLALLAPEMLVWEELVQPPITAAGRGTSAGNEYLKDSSLNTQPARWKHRGKIYPDIKRELMAFFASPADEGLDALPSQGLHAHGHRLWG